jgi:tetratricopeptide (TPR) repeat protein
MNRIKVKQALLILLTMAFTITNNHSCTKNSLIQQIKSNKLEPPQQISQKVLQKIKTQEYTEVEEFFDYLVEKKPFSINGHRLLEEIYSDISHRRDVFEVLTKWCEAEKTHHSAFVLRGKFSVHEAWRVRGSGFGYTVSEEVGEGFREQLRLAAKDFDTAYYLQPKDPNSAAALITICTGLGMDEKTMEGWFQKALKADPKAIAAYRAKMNYLFPKWRGSHQKSSRFAEECYNTPYRGSVIYTVAIDYLLEGARISRDKKYYLDQKQVQNMVDQIITRWLYEFPNSTYARTTMASIHYYRKNFSEAIRLCTRALEINPDDWSALHTRGNSYLYDKNRTTYVKAEADYNKLTRIYPSDDSAFFMLGHINLVYKENYHNAIKFFDEAIRLDKRDNKRFFWRGRAKSMAGKCELAIDDFSAAIEINPRYEDAYWERSACYKTLHQDEKAEKDSKTARGLRSVEMTKDFFAAVMQGRGERFVSSKKFLYLDTLEKLPAEIAKLLGKHEGSLYLAGLKNLTPDTAQNLSSHKGYLDLGGVESITPTIAKYLSKNDGELILSGLKNITVAEAKYLSRHTGRLNLKGLQHISPEIAKYLSKHKGGSITFSSVKLISPSTAMYLSQSTEPLDLSGLEKLSPATAEHLSNSKCRSLILNGLRSLTPPVAKYLSQYKGTLGLNGLNEITPAMAKYLGQHSEGALNLGGVKSISPETAKYLGQHRGRLNLSGLKSLSSMAAKNIGTNVPSLNLGSLEEITSETAKNLSTFKCQLKLGGLRSITAQMARHFRKHTGYLDLSGLEEINPEIAEHLSAHKGHYLDLDGLRKVSPEVKQILKKHRGTVRLPHTL